MIFSPVFFCISIKRHEAREHFSIQLQMSDDPAFPTASVIRMVKIMDELFWEVMQTRARACSRSPSRSPRRRGGGSSPVRVPRITPPGNKKALKIAV